MLLMRSPFLAFFSVLLFAPACNRAPDIGTRYVDFITSPGKTSQYEVIGPKPAFCGDELHFAWAMKPNGELSALTDFGENPKLLLSGCITKVIDPNAEEPAQLEIIAETTDGKRAHEFVPLASTSGWWSTEVDLTELAGLSGRVRLRARFPKQRLLVLKEFYLSHEINLPSRNRETSKVLLISVDTLREDAIAALGGSYQTPALDRFASESQVWSPHYAAAAMTKPSHASLLTGHHAWLHSALQDETPIRRQVRTLAERFQEAGFLTAGFAYDAVWLNPKFGFSRGFDQYRSVKWSLPQMIRHLTTWMSDHRGDSFFYFFHTFEVHSDFQRLPYEAPDVTRETILETFSVPNYGCRNEKCASHYLEEINNGMETLPAEAEILRFLYGQGVSHLDEQLGMLFDHLRRLGIYDDMMIVLTSDHGEALLEHNITLHGIYWEEVLRVPLIIKWPGGRFAGERMSVPSSAIDIAPTLLAAFGLPFDFLPGTPLPDRRPNQPIFVSTGWNAVILNGLKLVDVGRKDGKRGLLFDLNKDPAEMKEDSSRRPTEMAMLKRLLADRIEIDRQAIKKIGETASDSWISFTTEEKQRLRALGYLND